MNRRGIPQMLKQKNHLQHGEFKYQTNGSVAAIKWMDNKPVTMLCSCSNPRTMVIVKWQNEDGTISDIGCPEAVATYNRIMGGVDKFDQLRERYASGRRSVKWWHRIFYYVIDLAIVDAFIMWKMDKSSANHDQLTFRLHLVRQLVGEHTSCKRKGRAPTFLANKKTCPR